MRREKFLYGMSNDSIKVVNYDFTDCFIRIFEEIDTTEICNTLAQEESHVQKRA